MINNSIEFQNSLAYGTQGEKEVATIFLNNGYSILPMYQFKSLENSPKLFNETSEIISPDLIVFKNGKSLFVEVKKKTRWVKHFDTIETGCDYRLYLQYLHTVNTTGLNLIMVFNHVDESPNGMYFIDIKTEGRYWDGKSNTQINNKVYTPMYFFNFNNLKKLI